MPQNARAFMDQHLLDDVHSQLNPTRVAQIDTPCSLADLQTSVGRARDQGLQISVSGARHAMGGQQFADASLHLDVRGMHQVLGSDATRGLLHIEAGADWPRIIAASHALGGHWAIRQKQTGVDAVTLAGSLAANAHGRGLLMQPLVGDIEDLTLVDARGDVQRCSRQHNAELFALAVGGYGLFGLIHSAALRLAPRQRVRRSVDILDLQDAAQAVRRRVDEGCVYGDFQFVIDAADPRFLRRGVFACYQPVADDSASGGSHADLDPEDWLRLLKLAHHDKAAAFRLYAQHYLGTDGNVYWADEMQLSTYLPSYAELLQDSAGSAGDKETLVIGEHYVPAEQLLAFMDRAAQALRSFGTEVIYGTIRSIRRDDTSALPWARDDFACVIFNLRTPHSAAGIDRTARTFRALTDASVQLGGSFFLTYHRHATAQQVQAAYPGFAQWLQRKREHDPDALFTSTWYRHYRDAFAALAA